MSANGFTNVQNKPLKVLLKKQCMDMFVCVGQYEILWSKQIFTQNNMRVLANACEAVYAFMTNSFDHHFVICIYFLADRELTWQQTNLMNRDTKV